jgi:hypothetical protein
MAVDFLSDKEKKGKKIIRLIIFFLVIQNLMDKLETVSNVNQAEIGQIMNPILHKLN